MSIFYFQHQIRKLSLCLVLGFGFSAAFAQSTDVPSFASLTILPTGAQSLDISTGITTLTEGGTLTDETQKLTLTATYIRFKEAEFIEATEASVSGEFGSLSAPSIYVDLSLNELSAQSVELRYKNIVVTAKTLILFLSPNITRLSGDVTSSEPMFNADTVLINLITGDALLQSPYSFQNGPLNLSQVNEGKALQLSPLQSETGTLSYQASSVIDPLLLTSFEPYFKP